MFASGLEVLGVKKMISDVPELLKPLFVCMGMVKANDVIDSCYSPDLSHLNEEEQHVWGYHWNGLSLVIFPTQHVWKKFLTWCHGSHNLL